MFNTWGFSFNSCDILGVYKDPCTYASLLPPASWLRCHMLSTRLLSVFMTTFSWYRLVFKSEKLHKLSRLAAFKENALINFLRLWNATSRSEFCGCWQTEFITFNPLPFFTVTLSVFPSPPVAFQSVHVLLRLFIFFTCVCAQEQRERLTWVMIRTLWFLR